MAPVKPCLRLPLFSVLLSLLLMSFGDQPALGQHAQGQPASSSVALHLRYDIHGAQSRIAVVHPSAHGALAVAPSPLASLRPAPRDRWLAEDKAKHLVVSFLWVLGTQYMLVNKADWSEGDALPLSVASGAAAGIAKEWYDWRISSSRYFSRRDLVADAVGLALAAGVILL